MAPPPTAPATASPISVALVDDYDVVLEGLAPLGVRIRLHPDHNRIEHWRGGP